MIPTWAQATGVARVLASAGFIAPLTHSLVLSRGTGDPTYTRATTATFTDWEGVLRYVPAGCARFEGGRMVRNRVQTTSETLTNSAWTAIAVGATAPSDNTVQASAGAGGHYLRNAGGTAVVASVWLLQAKLTAGTYAHAALGDDGDAAYHSATFNLTLGTVTNNNNATGSILSLGGGEYLCSVVFTRTNAGSVRPMLGLTANGGTIDAGFVAAGTETVVFEEIQLEDVTGQADQSASEYVSVGVLSAPYHGAGVDGVKFFNTNRSGALLSPQPAYLAEGARTNIQLQSQTWSNAGWSVNNTTKTSTSTTNVDGTATALTLTANAGSAGHNIGWTAGLACSASTYTTSAIDKQGTSRYFSIFDAGDPATHAAGFDFQTLTATTSSATAASIVQIGTSGWYLAQVTYARTNATTIVPYIGPTDTQTRYNGVWTAAGTETLIVGAMQTELGSFASTYIPTTNAATQRQADVLTYPSAGNVDGTKGWCSAEFSFGNVVPSSWFGVVLSSGAGWIPYGTTGGVVRMFDGNNLVEATPSVALAGRVASIACSWGSNQSVCLDGSAPVTGTFDGSMNPSATIYIGCSATGTDQPFADISNVRIGQRQLSSSELQAITR